MLSYIGQLQKVTCFRVAGVSTIKWQMHCTSDHEIGPCNKAVESQRCTNHRSVKGTAEQSLLSAAVCSGRHVTKHVLHRVRCQRPQLSSTWGAGRRVAGQAAEAGGGPPGRPLDRLLPLHPRLRRRHLLLEGLHVAVALRCGVLAFAADRHSGCMPGSRGVGARTKVSHLPVNAVPWQASIHSR